METRHNEGLRDLTKSVRYNEVSFHRGSFLCISPLLGQKIAFVIPRTSLYRGSLYRGSTVLWFVSQRFDCLLLLFIRELNQRRQRRREQQKSNSFRVAKQQLCMASGVFVHFFTVLVRPRHEAV